MVQVQAGRRPPRIPRVPPVPPPLDQYHLMLDRIGLNNAAIAALENLGLDHIGSFHDITEKDIPAIVKELRRGGTLVKQTSQNFLQALRYWVMRQERLQRNYVPEEFTDVVMRHSLQQWQASSDKTPEDLIRPPDAFKQNTKWREFSEAFITFMQHTKGQCDFPLSYVLREDAIDNDENEIEHATQEAYEEAIVPLQGHYFDLDNNAVFDSLKSRLLNGPAWTWIQDYEKRRDGRGAWKALQAHFEGVSGQIRLKSAAYAAIKRAEYKGAKNFDFDLYKRVHTQAHADLKRYGEPVAETKKVKDFLDGITEPSLQPVKFTIAGFPNLMNNFTEAANYISQIVDLNRKTESITRQVSAIGGRGGRGYGGRGRTQGERGGRGGRGGRGRGRGRGRGGRGNTSPNAGRWITSDQWHSMSEEEREAIRNERSNFAKRKLSALTSSETPTPDTDSTTASQTNQSSNKRVQFADVTSAGDQMNRGNRNFISQIRSSQRYWTSHSRTISSTQRENTIITAKAELDSHADTTVAGSACKLLELTEQSCDVFPYSEQYEPIANVPIAKVATAYDHPQTGETFILVFGQVLYMPDTLEHSLLCPNQLRANGVRVDDIPRHLSQDGKSTHSIYFPNEQVSLPLRLKGVISYLETRYPTHDELQNCQWLTATSDAVWDPYSDSFAEQEEIMHEREGLPNPPSYDRQIFELSSYDTSYQSSIYHNISSLTTGIKSLSKTDEQLAKIFNCSPKIAANTRAVTTQKGIRSITDHLTRRFRTKQATLRYDQLGGRHGRFYSDTLFSSIKSLRGNTMGQIFVNDVGYTHLVPMKLKSEAGHALLEFIQDVGIPSAIHTDDAKEQRTGKWHEVCTTHGIKHTLTEPYSPFQNRAEVNIRELKKHVRRTMSKTKTPKRLWDFCATYVAELRCLTAQPLYSLHGRTPYEMVTGNTPDISEYISFSWYQPIWYYDKTSFPEERNLLGRWIGVAHNVGQAMCFWILPKSGTPIARTTVRPVTTDELQQDAIKQELLSFDQSIQRKIGDHLLNEGDLSFEVDSSDLAKALADVDDDIDGHYLPIEPDAEKPDLDDYDEETLDSLLSAEVLLPKGDFQFIAKVVKRKRDDDGNPVGRAHSNPILDTRVYEVEFPDGSIKDYAANVLAEALYAQVDETGNRFLLLKDIIDHEKDSTALSQNEAEVINLNGSRNPAIKFTTKGWKFCCQWTDGSTSWEPLRNLKESNPIELAEYAEARNLLNEPAFVWWAKDVLRRRRRIIQKVKSRYWQRTHKFGIRLPKTVAEALALDKENGNTLWYDAIQKELKNVQTAFRFLPEGERVPIGYKQIPCHIIFDIKMDFTRKARFVAGGHKTDPPSSMTYSSVVSRDSVRIAFLLSALNDLDILSADIGNAYINADVREKVYFIAGDEFGTSRKGQSVIITKALYGLKTSGAAWRAHFAEMLNSLGYTSSLADPDVWYRPEAKPDGFEYYAYVLVYVDDILVVSANPKDTMRAIEKSFRLKDGFAPPQRYLGATIKKWRLLGDEDAKHWGHSSEEYVKQAIINVELELAKEGKRLQGKYSTPMTANYRPELDYSPFLPDATATYYMELIGILRWAVELGRIDIMVDVSLLSSYTMQPRMGHLDQVFHIFGYLKRNKRATIMFDEQRVNWDETSFEQHDWTDFYHDAKEDIPPNAPPPRGNAVQINCFVDADHAGNRITRRSQTGILIFLNRAPIIWYSKSQNTVESSTFGSEFTAMRIAVELLVSLRYKLRMFGVPLEGPVNTFCDNSSVVTNSILPESTLKKKHNSIAYHRVREAIAANILRVAWVQTGKNLADMLTKPLAGPKLHAFCEKILYLSNDDSNADSS